MIAIGKSFVATGPSPKATPLRVGQWFA